MIRRHFYQELGNLLYAMALADGNIHPKELISLEKTLKGELKKIKADPEKAEMLFAKFNFYADMQEHKSPKKAFLSFMDFFEKHGQDVPQEDREIAIKLIRHIANAYKGLGPSEIRLEEIVFTILEK